MLDPIEEYVLESLTPVIQILRHRNRNDLASLLSRARVDFDVSSEYGNFLFSRLTTAEIYAPLADYDRLKSLSPENSERILEVILEIWPPRAHDMEITGVAYRLYQGWSDDIPNDTENLLELLDRLRNLMREVATGVSMIDSVNAGYKEDYLLFTKRLEERGLSNPIPYRDLWYWYHKWRDGSLPTYQSRREYINELFGPLDKLLRDGPPYRGTEIFSEPTGWDRIDRTLNDIQSRLKSASNEEEFQAVGLLCREALISVAQTVFDPTLHPALDGVKISETDAKRMLESYLVSEFFGRSNSVARKYARASVDLANELQHERTATFRKAALCAEATASVVNIIAIISGVRDSDSREV